jgi:hypothetical protein
MVGLFIHSFNAKLSRAVVFVVASTRRHGAPRSATDGISSGGEICIPRSRRLGRTDLLLGWLIRLQSARCPTGEIPPAIKVAPLLYHHYHWYIIDSAQHPRFSPQNLPDLEQFTCIFNDVAIKATSTYFASKV